MIPFALYPDLLLFACIIIVLFMDLFVAEEKRFAVIFNSSALALLGIAILSLYSGAGSLGNYQVREWTIPFRLIFSGCGFMSLLLARPAFQHGSGRERLAEPGAFVILLLCSVLGMHILSASSELITFFLGIEMATLPLYALSTWHRDKIGSEAGVKYLLIGALSTALLLFGCSFLFGASGSLEFSKIANASLDTGLMHLGVLFIMAALAFKLSAAPFHMWAPDVYAGAPSAVTAFIASASKAAGIVALLLMISGPWRRLVADLNHIFIILAVLSMLIGNLGAIKQTYFNRFMAYSSIAQIGFIFMALSGIMGHLSVPTIAFYMLVYACSNYAAFFVMQCLAERRPETLSSLRGLSQQSPLLALSMMLAMFSLAGIPPLAGFLGKLPLFFAAAEVGNYKLVFFAALNAVVALYYYMLIVKEAYVNKPEGQIDAISISASQRWALFLLVSAIIVLGLCPQPQAWVFAFYQ